MISRNDAAIAGATVEELEAALSARYDLRREQFEIADHHFDMTVVRDSYALVNAIAPDAFAANERLPYWADLWTSSVELARWCLTEPSVAGASILEIGCGVGLAGIAAAKAGGKVRMTDVDPDALLFARCNALKNLPDSVVRSSLVLSVLDWDAPGVLEPVDLILGGDVIYERSIFERLLDLFDKALRPGGSAVLTDPDRMIGRAFLQRAAERGYDIRSEAQPVMRGSLKTTVVRSHLCRSL
jgi:predicted nicotinamide N-methyase